MRRNLRNVRNDSPGRRVHARGTARGSKERMLEPDPSHDLASVLAFPVPEPPASVQTRVRPFAFPLPLPTSTPTTRTVIARSRLERRAPWHVPAWLPQSVEGPATFAVGALGGALLGVLAVVMTTLFMGQGSAPCANAELTLHDASCYSCCSCWRDRRTSRNAGTCDSPAPDGRESRAPRARQVGRQSPRRRADALNDEVCC